MDIDPEFFDSAIHVVVVGDISRTWYVDRRMFAELLDEPQPAIITHGSFGFDLMVYETAKLMDLPVRNHAVEAGVSWEERFAYRAPVRELLDGATSVVVLTRRSLPKEVWEVDPEVVETAVEWGVPIYALNEEGILWSWP